MGNITISGMVGGQQESGAINRTIKASNTGGSIGANYTIEELEELESRGVNPYWDKPAFLKELKTQSQQNGVWERFDSEMKFIFTFCIAGVPSFFNPVCTPTSTVLTPA